ncbi:lyase family protein [Vibrio metschnikovii]
MIPKDVANYIIQACDLILETGKCMDQFPSDVFQGGAGTSVNMNTNEVIANVALELMGKEKGQYQFINPNDHVNKSQSTNCAYPTGFRIAVYNSILKLIESIEYIKGAFELKAVEFKCRFSKWGVLSSKTPYR